MIIFNMAPTGNQDAEDLDRQPVVKRQIIIPEDRRSQYTEVRRDLGLGKPALLGFKV